MLGLETGAGPGSSGTPLARGIGMQTNQLMGLLIVLWVLGVFGPTTWYGWLAVVLWSWFNRDNPPFD